VIVFPEQGSFQVPQTLGGQVVFGTQQVEWSELEQTSPLAQLVAQFTTVPVQGSLNVPQ
jgi:hypothetical protein